MQFADANVLVAGHALFDAADDGYSGVGTDIGGDEDFLEVVQDFIVDLAFPGNGAGELAEETGLGLFEPGIEHFLFFFFGENVE